MYVYMYVCMYVYTHTYIYIDGKSRCRQVKVYAHMNYSEMHISMIIITPAPYGKPRSRQTFICMLISLGLLCHSNRSLVSYKQVSFAI